MALSSIHNRPIDHIALRLTPCRAQLCVADIRGAEPWSSSLHALGWTTHIVTVRDWLTGLDQNDSRVEVRLLDTRPLRDGRLQRLVAERLADSATPTVLFGELAPNQDLARQLHAIALLPPTVVLEELRAVLDQARLLAPRSPLMRAFALPRC